MLTSEQPCFLEPKQKRNEKPRRGACAVNRVGRKGDRLLHVWRVGAAAFPGGAHSPPSTLLLLLWPFGLINSSPLPAAKWRQGRILFISWVVSEAYCFKSVACAGLMLQVREQRTEVGVHVCSSLLPRSQTASVGLTTKLP